MYHITVFFSKGSCDNADVSSPDMLSQGQRTLRLHTQPSLSNTGNDNMDKRSVVTEYFANDNFPSKMYIIYK